MTLGWRAYRALAFTKNLGPEWWLVWGFLFFPLLPCPNLRHVGSWYGPRCNPGATSKTLVASEMWSKNVSRKIDRKPNWVAPQRRARRLQLTCLAWTGKLLTLSPYFSAVNGHEIPTQRNTLWHISWCVTASSHLQLYVHNIGLLSHDFREHPREKLVFQGIFSSICLWPTWQSSSQSILERNCNWQVSSPKSSGCVGTMPLFGLTMAMFRCLDLTPCQWPPVASKSSQWFALARPDASNVIS